MIVPMTKYDLVVYHGDKEAFLERLQDLGLVDITTTGWEPDESENALLASIERHNAALARLKELRSREGFVAGEPYHDGEQAWKEYSEAVAKLETIQNQIAAVHKEAEELKVWGEFDPAKLRELEKDGIVMRFYSVYTREFEALREDAPYDLEPVAEKDGMTYFVAITAPGDQVEINAHELKAPTATYAEKEREAECLENEKTQYDTVMARAAASIELIDRHASLEKERLQFSQVSSSAASEAEDTLVVMEAWAPREAEDKVDRMLEENPAIYFIKSKPTPEDDVPTLLKNKKPSRMFEIIGGFYSQPKYGTMDLTRYFGPFYALFFGLCLADAGYGLLYLLVGLLMIRKAKEKPGMANLANLVTILGASTLICGVLMDSFFGLKLTNWAPLAGLQKVLIGPHMFYIALGLGVIQILFAMCLKTVLLTKRYGFRHALSTIGWMLVIVAILPTIAGMLGLGVPAAITGAQPALWAMAGVGLFMMLFLNTPGKNPLLNFGKGLWNTYNDLTGFISDFLSYIRLFAIGLSGGILAAVFNDLAVGMSGGIPVVKQIIMVIILLIGHGLNIFMSSISSFVHPMRLTFVEFYKNAGFEDTQRTFTPFKRERETEM